MKFDPQKQIDKDYEMLPELTKKKKHGTRTNSHKKFICQNQINKNQKKPSTTYYQGRLSFFISFLSIMLIVDL